VRSARSGNSATGSGPVSMKSKQWECPYNREELLALYSTVNTHG
jgi:hypothetical protein